MVRIVSSLKPTMMTKQKFAELFLSRFRALDYEGRYFLISALVAAGDELNLEDWSQTISEILFPEIIGDLIIRGVGDEPRTG